MLNLLKIGDVGDLPMETSIKLYMYAYDWSGWCVKLLITATRTMANTVVRIVSEKTAARTNLLCVEMCTRRRRLSGIAMTELARIEVN